MFKSLQQLDRPTYWKWVIPLVALRVLFGIAAAKGINLGPLGPVDTFLIVILAMALVGRFRDIGWPTWIGASFLLITTLVVPLGIFLYAIATGDRSGDPLQYMLWAGLFAAPTNLLLLIVAGCASGKPAADTAQDAPQA